MNANWGGILVGTLVMIIGASQVVTGEGGSYWGHPIPAWTGWLTAPLGLFFIIISLRAILRGDGKPKKADVTDRDVYLAKAELERMYFKEYGTLPEYPDEEGSGDSGGSTTTKK